MARRGKETLIQAVLSPLRDDGWAISRLTPPGGHPARFIMARGAVEMTVKLYIWNLSHGGRGRADTEHRIQVTGVDQFEAAEGERTLILGWDDDLGVFGAFDVAARREHLGASPSVQITSRTMEAAITSGGALQAKRDREFAVAVRPDRLGRYIQNLETVHGGDISALTADPASDTDAIERRFHHLSDPGRRFDFSGEESAILRAEVRDGVDRLLSVLDDNPVPRGQIGHNGPPGPIEDDGPDLRASLEVVREEVGSDQPDGERLAKSGAVMAWISRGIDAVRAEAKAFATKGRELLREHVAKAIGGAVGGVLWNARDDIGRLLKSLLEVLIKWLELAAGLF